MGETYDVERPGWDPMSPMNDHVTRTPYIGSVGRTVDLRKIELRPQSFVRRLEAKPARGKSFDTIWYVDRIRGPRPTAEDLSKLALTPSREATDLSQVGPHRDRPTTWATTAGMYNARRGSRSAKSQNPMVSGLVPGLQRYRMNVTVAAKVHCG